MAQTIWIGNIHFADINVPVKLHTSVSQNRIEFHLFHKKDGIKLRQQMVCAYENKPVSAEEQVKGYRVDERKYVLMDPEELEPTEPRIAFRLLHKKDHSPLARKVDPIYLDRPYFLVPLKGGEKAYQLLAEALKRTGKAGLAKFVLDEREYLVLIKNRDGALEVNTLHYQDEILPNQGSVKAKGKFSAEEKSSIKKHIKGMTAKFSPGKYADRRREKLLAILKKKTQKHGVVTAPEIKEEAIEGVEDLMEALEESMRKMKKADEQKKRKHQP